MKLCPCGSGQHYVDCCEIYIRGTQSAPTAERLMRSRYSAYVKSEIDYIYQTTHPNQRDNFNRQESEAWSRKTNWHSLKILKTEAGGQEDLLGMVEFIARSRKKGIMVQHHELAEFKKEDGRWFFYDGHSPKYEQVKRDNEKVGRNTPCPCGSGRKFKKCCG